MGFWQFSQIYIIRFCWFCMFNRDWRVPDISGFPNYGLETPSGPWFFYIHAISGQIWVFRISLYLALQFLVWAYFYCVYLIFQQISICSTFSDITYFFFQFSGGMSVTRVYGKRCRRAPLERPQIFSICVQAKCKETINLIFIKCNLYMKCYFFCWNALPY